MSRQQKRRLCIAFLLLLILLCVLAMLALARGTGQTPVSNAHFVGNQQTEDTPMHTISHTEIPLCDANGNAGTHLPEKEIYYQNESAPKGQSRGEVKTI